MRRIPTALLAIILSTALAASGAADKSNTDPDDAGWHNAGASKGNFKSHGALKTEFSPKTANWRVKISTEKTNDKGAASIQVTFWVEVKVGPNKVYHAIPNANFRGTGSDSKVITFDNGLGPEGQPRHFKIEITGANVKNEMIFQDQDAESDKSDGKKGKKK